MSRRITALQQALSQQFNDLPVTFSRGELTVVVPVERLLTVAKVLRDEVPFAFEQLIDLCVVDYLHYGVSEWTTQSSTRSGFSRGVEPKTTARLKFGETEQTEPELQGPRFAVVYHLLSYGNNHRLRLKVYATDNHMPVVPSVIDIWPGVNWFEREAFDLYGVLFEGHSDLRRILTDYGFIGHPFRKDFPLIGNVEMRYDPEKKRVVYQPVTIEPRELVPRVIRNNKNTGYEAAAVQAAGDMKNNA